MKRDKDIAGDIIQEKIEEVEPEITTRDDTRRKKFYEELTSGKIINADNAGLFLEKRFKEKIKKAKTTEEKTSLEHSMKNLIKIVEG